MALIHRVNSNYSPLLSTFHCKCIVKIRFLTTQSKGAFSSQSDSELPKSFAQMLKFHRSEAKRSFVMKIQSYASLSDVRRFLQQHVNILRSFPYFTAKDQHFLLVELADEQQVRYLQELATYKLSSNCAHSVTPLFSYNSRGGSNQHNNAMSNVYSFPYSKFRLPLQTEISQQLQQYETVSEQMVALHENLRIDDLNVRLRFYTAEMLTYYLTRLFANLYVVPFGSSVNGFGQVGCDLDLLCRTHNKKVLPRAKEKRLLYNTQPIYFTDRIEQKEFLDMISTIIRMCVPGMNNIKKILNARVPIIKFFNVNTNMQCDLSSTNLVAMHMSELLYIYATLDRRVQPLTCTIRRWARIVHVTKENPGNWITNFSLTLLIIFYLQQKNVLPSLNSIKSYVAAGVDVQGSAWYMSWWNSQRYKKDESLHNLLYGFFEYYSLFDFSTKAICIREGRLMPKKDNSPVYIYNPFNLLLNVSQNITFVELARLVQQFRVALQTMTDSSENKIILKLIEGKQWSAQPPSAMDAQDSDECNCDEKQGLLDEELYKDKVKKELKGGVLE